MIWIKNTDGRKDAVLTMALLGFLVVVVKVLLGGMHLVMAGKDITVGTIDASTIGALLTPTLGAYVARRYTDVKYKKAEKVESAQEKKA